MTQGLQSLHQKLVDTSSIYSSIQQEGLRFALIVIPIRGRSISREYHHSINFKTIRLQHPQRIKKPIPLNPSPIHFITRKHFLPVKLLRPNPKRLQIFFRSLHFLRVKLVIDVIDDVAVILVKLDVRRRRVVKWSYGCHGNDALVLQQGDEFSDAVGES